MRTLGRGGGGDSDLTSPAELVPSSRVFNVDGEARMTRPPCFVVGELSLSGGKDSGNATGGSCEAEARMEVTSSAFLRLSERWIPTNFGGEIVPTETKASLRGGVWVCVLRLSSSSDTNVCCCSAEGGFADGPRSVDDDAGGDGGPGRALCLSKITFEWEIFGRGG